MGIGSQMTWLLSVHWNLLLKGHNIIEFRFVIIHVITHLFKHFPLSMKYYLRQMYYTSHIFLLQGRSLLYRSVGEGKRPMDTGMQYAGLGKRGDVDASMR